MKCLHTFIGVDLAWQRSNLSGIAILRGDETGAELDYLDHVRLTDLPSLVAKSATKSTAVAVDAPLVVKNEAGQRPCEGLVSARYFSQHGGCHSSNLTLYPDLAGVWLTEHLLAQGFRHAPEAPDSREGSIMLEVFPHPAMIELFGLKQIIKYKKGRVTQKQSGQRELQSNVKKLSASSPPLNATPKLCEIVDIDPSMLKGSALKANEDKLDAIICAYIALYYWKWGWARTQLFGDVDSGYIMVPSLS